MYGALIGAAGPAVLASAIAQVTEANDRARLNAEALRPVTKFPVGPAAPGNFEWRLTFDDSDPEKS
jgi:hypothetical protein